jgi:hypothetical protein
MNPRQRRFVEEYLVDLNAARAAKRAVRVAGAARQSASERLDDAPHRRRRSSYPPIGPANRADDLRGSLSMLLGITAAR